MFIILVGIPFEFVTRELEGVLWWTFNFCTTVWPNLKIVYMFRL